MWLAVLPPSIRATKVSFVPFVQPRKVGTFGTIGPLGGLAVEMGARVRELGGAVQDVEIDD